MESAARPGQRTDRAAGDTEVGILTGWAYRVTECGGAFLRVPKANGGRASDDRQPGEG